MLEVEGSSAVDGTLECRIWERAPWGPPLAGAPPLFYSTLLQLSGAYSLHGHIIKYANNRKQFSKTYCLFVVIVV